MSKYTLQKWSLHGPETDQNYKQFGQETSWWGGTPCLWLQKVSSGWREEAGTSSSKQGGVIGARTSPAEGQSPPPWLKFLGHQCPSPRPLTSRVWLTASFSSFIKYKKKHCLLHGVVWRWNDETLRTQPIAKTM